MKKLVQNNKSILPFTVLVFLLSFYHFDSTIETGLDPSYAFGLNYIFAHQIAFGTDIIYTYGPLGFLSFPQDMGSNFLLAIILVSAIRFTFIVVFLALGNIVNKEYRILHVFLAFIICNVMYLDFILVGATTVLVITHALERKHKSLILASLFTVIALLIKSSFGLMCTSIVISYAAYDYFSTKGIDAIRTFMTSGIVFFFLIWLVLYRNVNGVYNYFYGIWQLSTGNSSAMILEVKNNWYLVFLFALSFFSIPFMAKQKNVSMLYIISLLSLYAAWKYAFSREENYHLKFFFDYLILFFSLFILISVKLKPQLIAVLLAAVFMFFQSMKATGMYTIEQEFTFSGLQNFSDLAFNYESTLDDSKSRTMKNLEKKKLSNEILEKIKNETVDFFPWELTYVAANNLNWKPRPNMQSGAYTTWLDRNNANFIASKNAPRFYLWEMEKPNGGVACFDDRYLLNDEPFTIFNLFNNYEIVYSDSSNVLFQKSKTLRFPILSEGKENSCNWNNWIQVPPDTGKLIRIKVLLENNLIGKIRKSIYKDIIYYTDYKLADNTVKTFRIVRETATNGLWVAPLIERISDGLQGKQVKSIRFRSSNDELISDSISYQWQIITLAENQHSLKNDRH